MVNPHAAPVDHGCTCPCPISWKLQYGIGSCSFFSFFEEAKSTVVLPLFGGDGEKMNWMMSS